MLTVCICTYNRAASLSRTLDSLAAQAGIEMGGIEVIVVDNNCTDNTPEVVNAHADKLPIRRVVETSQGLSHSRNRGAREARGEWIVYTDDDVVLDSRWLASFAAAFDRHPEAQFAGGSIRPLWSTGQPRWFKGEHLDLIDGILGWYELSPRSTRVLAGDDPPMFGASFAVRRTLVDELSGFRADLGVCGKSVGRGEETEFIHRARRAGRVGIYVGEALCWHVVDPRRLKLPALYRYGISSAQASRTILGIQGSGSMLKAAEYVVRGLLQCCKGRGDRFRQCVINAGIQAGFAVGD